MLLKRVYTNNLWLREKIKERVSGSENVLEFGCGTGELLEQCLNLNANFYGCDINLYSEELENRLGKTSEVINNIRKSREDYIPFDDNVFDICVSNQVFEHVSEISIMCSELNRILKPGAEMFLSFPVKEIFIEPHLKLPLIHRISYSKRITSFYLNFAYCFKFGAVKNTHLSRSEWVENRLEYLKNSVNYLTEKSFIAILEKNNFVVSNISRQHYIERFGMGILTKLILYLVPIKRVSSIAIYAKVIK